MIKEEAEKFEQKKSGIKIKEWTEDNNEIGNLWDLYNKL